MNCTVPGAFPGRQPRRGGQARSGAPWIVAALAVLGAFPGLAMAGGPPSPPGPPPGNGGDLPVSPGTEPVFVPPGVAGTIIGGAPGPGLVSGSRVAFNRATRRFSVTLACQAGGSIAITVRKISSRALATAGYGCVAGRATANFRVSPKFAAAIARHRVVAAIATVRQGGARVRLYLTLRTGSAAAKGFWTDGNLQCTPNESTENLAYLASPDFTAKTLTPISTRGWVAWYTTAGGWHWLGQDGENAGRWQTWTATPTGVAQFHPNGAVNPVPWTFGPISVPGGQGLYAVGVYEIVYWVAGSPQYRWQYVNAGAAGAVASGAPTTFCFYA